MNNRIFLTSDTHFFHKNIIEYENRPYKDIYDMNESLIENWNTVVGKTDTVYHLGDVGFGNVEALESIILRLNGRKKLIIGNHDKRIKPDVWKRIGFDTVYDLPVVLENFFILSHKPPQYMTEKVPYVWIYGHVHSSPMYQTITKNSVCMCVERWDYKPVSFDEVKNMLATS
jgi:calcineurin-like phosphoesterase family protein